MAEDFSTVQLAHGSGGRLSQQLLTELLLPVLGPPSGIVHDAARWSAPGSELAFTTDCYVVQPLFFPGGDIGRLAVFGSVNDLCMAGARPLALSLGLILEEGLQLSCLQQVIASIADACAQCGVSVITGDTKVVERGKGDGVFINTSAIGVVDHGLQIHPSSVRPGDAVLVSGDVGRHGVAILAARNQLGLRTALESDLASLQQPVQALLESGLELHCLRDLTRGGLASAVDELARASGCSMVLEDSAIPLHPTVEAACDLLGLDPLAMANEGRMVVICPEAQAAQTLTVLKAFQGDAARIGTVLERSRGDGGGALQQRYPVQLRSALGVLRPLDISSSEQLPRIC
jgi:hydrogenase expression/formation protein HypE